MRQLLLLILLVLAGRWLARMIRAADGARVPGASAAGAHADAGAGRSADGAAQTRRTPFGGRPAAREARSLAEPMVRCAACGVHAPKSDSLFAGGDYFCCAEHARRHAARAAGER